MKIHHVEKQNKKEAEASARGRNAKDKGGRFEKEVENLINRAFTDEGEARRGFKSDIDVEVLDPSGRLAFNIECKCGKRINVRGGYRQAQEKRRAASIPIEVWKDDGAPNEIFAVVGIDLLIEFMRLYLKASNV